MKAIVLLVLVCVFARADAQTIDSLKAQIYPNPCIAEVTLPYNAEVYDLAAKKIKVLQAWDNKVDVSKLPLGIYFVRFQVDGREYVVKLVKKDE